MPVFHYAMRNPVPRIMLELKAMRRVPAFAVRMLFGPNGRSGGAVVYVAEKADWVIKWIGEHISKGVGDYGIKCVVDTLPRYYFDGVVHFGSVHSFRSGQRLVNNTNRTIATVFHGDFGLGPEMDESLGLFVSRSAGLSRVVVANSIMRRRVISWGVPERLVSLIPLGVDLSIFAQPTAEQKRDARARLGIPEDAVCVGSFQKDGVGWGEGLEPKLIKGPDLLVEVLAGLSRRRKIHCLLAGPARGYVKAGLSKAGVPFTHLYARDHAEIAGCYHCLDMYLVASREEGGPQSLLEAMASGVPLVTSRVGMAVDIVENGVNAISVEPGDVGGLIEGCYALIEDRGLGNRVVSSGLETANKYGWGQISAEYARLYREVMGQA